MLDLKWIRENPELALQGLKAKCVSLSLDTLLALDKDRRALLKEVEDLKAKRNLANDEIANSKKAGKLSDTILQEMKTISQKIKEIDQKVVDFDSKIAEIIHVIPNIPLNDVPRG